MNNISYRHLPRFDHLEPRTVEEVCSLLSKYKGEAKVIAGGTDLLPAMRNRKLTPGYIINIKPIANLDYIDYDDTEGLRIGVLATLRDIETSPVIREKFPMIANAACKIGTPQVRNAGTIGGNLCNAAPSADTAPPLIGLEARAKINGPNKERIIALEEFFTGPGQTVLQAGEILTEIQVPNPLPHTRGVYLKLPARSMVDLAVVGVAIVITLDNKEKTIADAKIILGAVAPTPIRARQAEDIIKGKAISSELIEKAAEAAAEEAKPISDLRGSASYRKEMVKVLTKQGIRQLITPA